VLTNHAFSSEDIHRERTVWQLTPHGGIVVRRVEYQFESCDTKRIINIL